MKRDFRIFTGKVVSIGFAHTFWARAAGLLFRRPLHANEGLLIAPCASVHTFGMRYALDVVFVDGLGRITRIAHGVKPWCVVQGGTQAVSAIEFRAGSLDATARHEGELFLLPGVTP